MAQRPECKMCGKRVDCLVQDQGYCICLEVRDMEECYFCLAMVNSNGCNLECNACDLLPSCLACEYTFCKYFGCPVIKEVLANGSAD